MRIEDQRPLAVLDVALSVCKLRSADGVVLCRPFGCLTATEDEWSLVCPDADVPGDALEVERGFCALKVCGALDFSLVGIIARIAGVLAARGIAVFVVSTFDTDYVLIKRARLEDAIEALEAGGYEIEA